jgi:surface polysaccharide O-acyltransferase-like enzyme
VDDNRHLPCDCNFRRKIQPILPRRRQLQQHLASAALFLLLASVPSRKIKNRFPRGNHVLKLISQNTLPIFLFHVIVLESLQKGYFGFTISITKMNPIIEIPLITALTLLICLAVIVPLKKIPYVKRIIG